MSAPRRPCTIVELQQLEEEAWASPAQRALYSTRHIPGFPWHTVQEVSSPDKPAAANATALFTTGARRHVIPYDFLFTVFVKGRWVGRRLLEVYTKELPHHTPAYYEACLRKGRLYCVQRGTLSRHNTQRRLLKRSAAMPVSVGRARSFSDNALDQASSSYTAPTTTEMSGSDLRQRFHSDCRAASAAYPPSQGENVVLQHGDIVYHTVHRHEVPVTLGVTGTDAVLITAVCITHYGLICVNKPTGLPTHATGRYYYNSLTALLEYVLAPKRLAAWLLLEDPLLQSLVSTELLSRGEKSELYAYYAPPPVPVRSTGSVHQPCEHQVNSERNTEPRLAYSHCDCATATDATASRGADLDEIDPEKVPRPCHRLDKVTSGVLLLAVRQDAAKRIGLVLMRKAKEVEEAVAAELLGHGTEPPVSRECLCQTAVTPVAERMASHNGCDGDTGLPALGASSSTSPSLPTSLQRILAGTYDLQKYYLARVRVESTGVLPASGKTSEAETQRQHTLDPPPLTSPHVPLLPPSPLNLWRVSGGEPCLRTHNAYLSRMLSSTNGVCDIASVCACKPMKYTSALPGVFPDGVLTTVRTPAPETLTPSASAAATLFQCLSALPTVTTAAHQHSPPQTGTSVASATEEALVLCTPYTGRLHQIRMHLSSLDCPIVGDVVYARTTGSADVPDKSSTQAQPQPLRGKPRDAEDVTCDSDTSSTKATAARYPDTSVDCAAQLPSDDRNFVFFDAAQLPAAYRRFAKAMKTAVSGVDAASCSHQTSPSSRKEEQAVIVDADDGLRAKSGVKRSRAESSTGGGREAEMTEDLANLESQDARVANTTRAGVVIGAETVEEEQSSAAITSWQDEPLCYECAGRLPVVAAGECTTGTSAICLHAWVYQVREALLLGTDNSAPSKASSSSASHFLAFSEDGARGAQMNKHTPQCSPSRGRVVVENDFVCFEAPPPAWLQW
ncbi:RNA pseudouridylate synthase, putative [Leishmania guyanensis]|uniref:Uncharacterized protein n=1 Tax=Leishmania guyanensis TaxID=5670 RepID=A0A1E1IYL7_LEIGU|nr:hypothetical protein, conserved [Leishmania guyanensis]